jgi:hypothetical protein
VLPPEFVAVCGDWFTSLLLLQADVWVKLVVKFLCGVPVSVQVFVEAPCAAGAAIAPIANAAAKNNLIRLDIPDLLSLLPSAGDNERYSFPAPRLPKQAPHPDVRANVPKLTQTGDGLPQIGRSLVRKLTP